MLHMINHVSMVMSWINLKEADKTERRMPSYNSFGMDIMTVGMKGRDELSYNWFGINT